MPDNDLDHDLVALFAETGPPPDLWPRIAPATQPFLPRWSDLAAMAIAGLFALALLAFFRPPSDIPATAGPPMAKKLQESLPLGHVSE